MCWNGPYCLTHEIQNFDPGVGEHLVSCSSDMPWLKSVHRMSLSGILRDALKNILSEEDSEPRA